MEDSAYLTPGEWFYATEYISPVSLEFRDLRKRISMVPYSQNLVYTRQCVLIVGLITLLLGCLIAVSERRAPQWSLAEGTLLESLRRTLIRHK